MLLRAVLEFVFVLLAARAVWRLIGGIVQGLGPTDLAGARSPQPGVTMVRDPVCGTFVLPDRALTISDGRARVHFCSPDCPRQVSVAARHDRRERAARRHRRGRTASVRSRLHRVERRQHQRAPRCRPAADDAEERLQGVHDPRHDVHHRSRGTQAPGRPRSVVGNADAPRGLPAAAGRAGGRPRASADRHRLRGRRHSARTRRCWPRC